MHIKAQIFAQHFRRRRRRCGDKNRTRKICKTEQAEGEIKTSQE